MTCYDSHIQYLLGNLPVKTTFSAVEKHPAHLARIASVFAADVANTTDFSITQNHTIVNIFQKSSPVDIASISRNLTRVGDYAFVRAISEELSANTAIKEFFNTPSSAKIELAALLNKNNIAEVIVEKMKDSAVDNITLKAINGSVHAQTTTTATVELVNIEATLASAENASKTAKAEVVAKFIESNAALNANATATVVSNLDSGTAAIATALTKDGIAPTVASAKANDTHIEFSGPVFHYDSIDAYTSAVSANNFSSSEYHKSLNDSTVTVYFKYPTLDVDTLKASATAEGHNAFSSYIAAAFNTTAVSQAFSNVTNAIASLISNKSLNLTSLESDLNEGVTLHLENNKLSATSTNTVKTKLLDVNATIDSANKNADVAKHAFVVKALDGNHGLNASAAAEIIIDNLKGNMSSLVGALNEGNITATENGTNVIFNNTQMTTINLANLTNVDPQFKSSLDKAFVENTLATLSGNFTAFFKYIAEICGITGDKLAIVGNALDKCCPADAKASNQSSCDQSLKDFASANLTITNVIDYFNEANIMLIAGECPTNITTS